VTKWQFLLTYVRGGSLKHSRQHWTIKLRRNLDNCDYLQHLALETKIMRYIGELNSCPLNGTDYVTYAIKERIRSVGLPDHELPFYVEQTSNLGRRALEHFKEGAWPTTDRRSVYWRMHQILKAYRVPVFEVLERTTTLTSSLRSESTWVQRFIEEGHAITNQWTEHKPGKFDGRVPAKRIWAFTLRQALLDGVSLAIDCKKCGCSLDLPLEDVANVARLQTTLHELRSTFRCPQCGATPCLRVDYCPDG
jgi:hypothetical protein